MDKAIRFVTRSVLCVVLKEEEDSVRAVVQLINKKAAEGEEAGSFAEADATAVREHAGEKIYKMVDGITLHQV